MDCLFVSDLHGKKDLYNKLFEAVQNIKPEVVLIGGDLFPHGYMPDDPEENDFLTDFFIKEFSRLKQTMKEKYPWFLIIPGNDDPRSNESRLLAGEYDGVLWNYLHNRKVEIGGYKFFGYSFIPPSPFGLKDWEKYDVSRFVDPGCTHPFEGMRSVKPDYDPEYSNIKEDLVSLTREENLSNSVFLFNSPPYNTPLDRAALDGKMIDYVPLDVHVGSIAIQRFIEERQPLVTLHGHIHEASSITGEWNTKIGDTYAFNAAYDHHKLSIIRFDPANPEEAERRIV